MEDPDFFRLQWEATGVALQEERYQDAARLLERLLGQKRRIPADDVARVQRRLAAVYVYQALELKPLEGNRRNALQAVRLLEKAAGIDPGQPAPEYWCGVIYRWFGLWEKALDCFRRALDIDPGHLPTRLELSWALLRLGELDQVRALLARGPSPARQPTPAASGPQPTPAASGPQPTPAASGPQPTPATAAPQPQLSPVPSAASPGTDVTRGQWQRLTAAVLLAEGRAAEAFAAYPGGPPEGMLVSQWLEEFLHLAEAAGHRDPAGVLARLETMSDELEMLLDSAGPDQTSPEPRERWQGLIRHLQALVAFAQGELETSISHWRAACEANPKDARLRQHLIRALTWRGNRDWRAGRTEEAVAAWAEARQRGGQDPELLRRLGLGYERLQLWQEANRCWEDYLRQLPEDDAGVAHNAGPSRGAVFLAMAANAARAGRRDEAQKLLARAVRHASDRTDLLVWAGLLYITLGNGQKAVSALTRALELAPGDERAVQGLLHAAALADVDPLPVITGLRETVSRLPRTSWTFQYWREQTLALGRRLWNSGAADEAMELFASLLLADPGDIDAWLWAGTVHARRGHQSGAEDCFAEAIRLNPRRSRTYLDLGARFLAAGDRERAEAHFEQAVRTQPGPHTHVTIGELCAEIGVPDLAEQHFRASLAGGRGAEHLLVRAILGLVRTGYDDLVHPFLEEAFKQVPDSIQVRILLAVQHLRHEEWVAADETLREAEEMARKRGAQNLLDHADYFRRSLILMRTIGHIDQEEFRERVKTLLSEWLQASSDGPPEPAGPAVEPVEAMLARLPALMGGDDTGGPEGALPDGALPDGALPDGTLPDSAFPAGGTGDLRLFLRTALTPIPVRPASE